MAGLLPCPATLSLALFWVKGRDAQAEPSGGLEGMWVWEGVPVLWLPGGNLSYRCFTQKTRRQHLGLGQQAFIPLLAQMMPAGYLGLQPLSRVAIGPGGRSKSSGSLCHYPPFFLMWLRVTKWPVPHTVPQAYCRVGWPQVLSGTTEQGGSEVGEPQESQVCF